MSLFADFCAGYKHLYPPCNIYSIYNGFIPPVPLQLLEEMQDLDGRPTLRTIEPLIASHCEALHLHTGVFRVEFASGCMTLLCI